MNKQKRVILHSDLNNFFASVELALHPEHKGKPLVVCGDPKQRHGVVLAKNQEAKALGVKTAETVYSALRKCPDLILAPTRFHEYTKYSQAVREIYGRYTEKIEECSIDECALDMTESVALFGDGKQIAERIRGEVKAELGLTVSVGVSFNKVYAKLASELKKPDAVTVISEENYPRVVFPLSVSELLFVGNSTARALQEIGIRTIGDLAQADEELLIRKFGKRGKQLRIFARGEDDSPVEWQKKKEDTKSISNSMTLPYDVHDREEIKRWLYALSESVATRQREADVGKANTVHLVVRNEKLQDFTCQTKVSPTALCGDIAKAAYTLFCQHCQIGTKVRMIGVSVSGFDHHVEQLIIGETGKDGYEKRERAESAIAKLRQKYGYSTLQRGIVMGDKNVDGLDIRGKKEDTISKD